MSHKAPLSVERLRQAFHYDPSTGVFRWRFSPHNGIKPWAIAGSVRADGYWCLHVWGIGFTAHRAAWAYMTGEWPPLDIDHKDGDPANNVWENLRCVSTSVNMQNQRRAKSNNKSGMLGAHFNARLGKYVSAIRVDGKPKYLGVFITAEDAHEAHLAARRMHYEGNTL